MKVISTVKKLCLSCMEEHEVKRVEVQEENIFKGIKVDYPACIKNPQGLIKSLRVYVFVKATLFNILKKQVKEPFTYCLPIRGYSRVTPLSKNITTWTLPIGICRTRRMNFIIGRIKIMIIIALLLKRCLW
jgi:hypothetical protein